jgi:hypothetical protein
MKSCKFIISIIFLLNFSIHIYSQGLKIFISGDSADVKRINFVFLAEGYTQQEQQKFISDVRFIKDGVFSTKPYKEYASYFNVWAIFVASLESGADHPLQNIYKNTYFEATFGTTTERLVTIKNSSKVWELLSIYVPEYDIVCVLVNDSQYGGMGGNYSVATVHSSSVGLVLHETGHSFVRLADEYESAYTLTPSEHANVTAQTQREKIRWNAWILPQTPIPTPETNEYANVVGLFEGAIYQTSGWYRPKLNCMMRNLGVPFCEVCTEEHIVKFYSRVSPIISKVPQSDTVYIDSKNTAKLSLISRAPQPNTLKKSWYVNGVLISAKDTFTLDTFTIINQINKVSAKVTDTTELVKIPINKTKLQDSVSWIVIRKKETKSFAHISNNALENLHVKISKGKITLFGFSQIKQELNLRVFNSKGALIYKDRYKIEKSGDFVYCIKNLQSSIGIYYLKINNRILFVPFINY